MQKRVVFGIFLVAVLTFTGIPARAATWSIQADLAEGCSCDPGCPCVFGSSPTHDFCEGSRLVEIKKGHYGDVKLDGVTAVISFRMGEWAKYYVSDQASDQQAKAAERLRSAAFETIASWGVVSSEKVAVNVEHSKDQVKFSSPSSTVEIEVMKGRDGQPIQVQNLPMPGGLDYTQHKTVVNSHETKTASFSHSGTHGFTSRIDTSGEE
jgi:hypothetical protein